MVPEPMRAIRHQGHGGAPTNYLRGAGRYPLASLTALGAAVGGVVDLGVGARAWVADGLGLSPAFGSGGGG